jgi:hypothetical protein
MHGTGIKVKKKNQRSFCPEWCMGPWMDPDPLNDKLEHCVLHLSPQNYACVIVSEVVYRYFGRIAFKITSPFDFVVKNYCTMHLVANKCAPVQFFGRDERDFTEDHWLIT